MNSAAETVNYPCVLPFNDPGHQQLQIRKESGNTVNISPLPASIPSAFAPLLISVASSQSSRTSPCPAATASPWLRPEIASRTLEKWNAARPSDTAQDKPQCIENEARLKSGPPIARPQSRWAQKQSEEVKPVRSVQGARHLTDKEKAAAKIYRRARKYSKRVARAAKAAKVNEKWEALAAEIKRGQRLWLSARRRRARLSSMSVVVNRRAVTYKPAGTSSKSAPAAQRRQPRQDLSEETDGEGWPSADETVLTHTPAVPCNPPILYKPPGSGAKSAPGQRLVILPRVLDSSDETDDEDRHSTDETDAEGRHNTDETDDEGRYSTGETVVTLKHEVPPKLYEPSGSDADSAPGQRLVIVPPLPVRDDSSDESGQDACSDSRDESGQDDWSDVDEIMSSVTSENLERERSRMLQPKIGFEELMQGCYRWPDRHEPLLVVAEQDREHDEIQYERVEGSYDSGEETEEEDWSNINPKTLLTPYLSTRFG